jgi:hypothetical protein
MTDRKPRIMWLVAVTVLLAIFAVGFVSGLTVAYRGQASDKYKQLMCAEIAMRYDPDLDECVSVARKPWLFQD